MRVCNHLQKISLVPTTHAASVCKSAAYLKVDWSVQGGELHSRPVTDPLQSFDFDFNDPSITQGEFWKNYAVLLPLTRHIYCQRIKNSIKTRQCSTHPPHLSIVGSRKAASEEHGSVAVTRGVLKASTFRSLTPLLDLLYLMWPGKSSGLLFFHCFLI